MLIISNIHKVIPLTIQWLEAMDEEEYLKELNIKSKEELNEYFEAENDEDAVEELADLLEIIHTLTYCHGSTPEKLEQVRKEKAAKRGGFQEKIYLIEVEDDK